MFSFNNSNRYDILKHPLCVCLSAFHSYVYAVRLYVCILQFESVYRIKAHILSVCDLIFFVADLCVQCQIDFQVNKTGTTVLCTVESKHKLHHISSETF